jgi:signal transduction histidine kinase
VREATSNAVRHGHAKVVRIQIHANEQVRLTIADDGRGFDPGIDHGRESFGLISMRERAEGMNGRLSIRSQPGEGTTVEVVVPNGEPEPPATRRGGRGAI